MATRRSPEPDQCYRQYTVLPKYRGPLLAFILAALERNGCRIIQASPPNIAPFRVSFETAGGERMGILAYAFYANNKLTKNRPADEYRFQLKYGKDTKEEHDLWQDPYGLYTTLLMGVSPEEDFFVG